jgi:hypothetical protein
MIERCGRTRNGGGKCESPALKRKILLLRPRPQPQRRTKAAFLVPIPYSLFPIPKSLVPSPSISNTLRTKPGSRSKHRT